MVPGGVWMQLAVAALVCWRVVTCVQDEAAASSLWSSLNPPRTIPGAVEPSASKSIVSTAALIKVPGSSTVRKRNLAGYVFEEPHLAFTDSTSLEAPALIASATTTSPENFVNDTQLVTAGTDTLQRRPSNVAPLSPTDTIAGPIAVGTNATSVTAAIPALQQIPTVTNSKVPVPDASGLSSSRVVVDELTQETLSPEEQISRFYDFIGDLTASNIRVPSDTGGATTKIPLNFIGYAFSTAARKDPGFSSASLHLQPSTLPIDTKGFSPTRTLKLSKTSSLVSTPSPLVPSAFVSPQVLYGVPPPPTPVASTLSTSGDVGWSGYSRIVL